MTGSTALMQQPAPLHSKDWMVALGLCLFCFALYALSGSGRIDIIDGQFRYEVARNLVHGQGVQVEDPALARAIVGKDGLRYAFYGPAASMVGAPWVALASLLGLDQNGEMFFFSFASALVVGMGIGIFFLFERRLQVSRGRALIAALLLAFATPMWPLATTVFDQGQQAVVLLLAVFVAWEAGMRASWRWSAAAGLIAGSLILFQEGLGLLVPFVGLCVFSSLGVFRDLPRLRRSMLGRDTVRALFTRFTPYVLGCLFPLALWMLFNWWRFGAPLDSGKSHIVGHPPLFGNPLQGALGLLFSPGKSIFLFFPTVVFSLYYFRGSMKRQPVLASSILGVVVVQFAFNSTLTFWASDWAWGPRYLMMLTPLLSLLAVLGMGSMGRGMRRIVFVLAGWGVLVQLLGISVEHHRFFFEHKLSAFFWYSSPEVYWQESQFFSRFVEVASIITDELPSTAELFRPGPYADKWPTYCTFGGPPLTSDIWMRLFSLFYLWRPWPLWIGAIDPALRPVDPTWMFVFFVGLLLLGGALILRGMKKEDTERQ